MERSIGAVVGAVAAMLVASHGAQAQQQRIAPRGPSTEVQLGEAANAIGAMSSVLGRGEPQHRGAGAVDLATRDGGLSMPGLFEGLAPADISFSSQGTGGIVLAPWVELSGLRSQDRLRRYEAQVLELGLDAALWSGLTVGASVALVRSQTGIAVGFLGSIGGG